MESIDVVPVGQPPRADSRWRKVEVALEGPTEVLSHTIVLQYLEGNLKSTAQRTQVENNLASK